MIQKVKNVVEILCDAVDFTQGTNMEIYVVQGLHKFIYNLDAASAHKAIFEMPKSDAMMLSIKPVKMQFALTIKGAAVVSSVEEIPVLELLRGDGYGD